MRGAEHLEFEAVSPGQCPKARASESSCTVNPSNRHCEVRPGNEAAMRGEGLRCAAKLATLIRGAWRRVGRTLRTGTADLPAAGRFSG
jgi:hypothetical protein